MCCGLPGWAYMDGVKLCDICAYGSVCLVWALYGQEFRVDYVPGSELCAVWVLWKSVCVVW